jgi:deoxyribonuclease-4
VKVAPIFSHAGYLINLGATDAKFYEQSIRAMADELHRAQALGLPFVVIHPGSHMGRGEDAGLKQIALALDQALAVPAAGIAHSVLPRVALEVTAGQGNCLGHRFEHLARIYERVGKPERLAVCLDTAHLFAAGYDIRTRKGYDQTMKELDRILGIKQVVAIHVNDSKTPLGSRVDRHAHIGKGHLGLDTFRFVMTDPRFRTIPKVLETPKEDEADGVSKMDKRNLAVLRKLATG